MWKKQKNCDENNPADARCGDNWDHVALDAENKLVLEVVNGKRTEENTELLVQKTAERLNFKPPRLITSDEYKPYKKAILKAFGEKRTPERTGNGNMKQHLPDDEELPSDVPQSAENLLTLAIFIEHRTVEPTPRRCFRHNQQGG